ncbi:MAG: branched-chain amino acid transport system II carrier protein [Clostridia bacterium]|nr:branched-chain amino acid transport system II carrier protein [Clostridia bacterium]
MEQQKKHMMKDVVVVGFAMFAIFFGAGNLIFPPYLGMLAGRQWFVGFLCFILADAGLAVMTVLAIIHSGGDVVRVFGRLGRVPARLLVTLAMLCVGPLICIPRTCATTYEMGMVPLFPGVNSWVFAAVFFSLVFFLTVRPSAVVDIIGKILTPVLLLALAVLFVKGIVTPIGAIRTEAAVNVAGEGFLAGYQTMDILGAMAITMVVVHTVRGKGYTTAQSQRAIVSRASVVAVLGLFVVYCGLTFLGATTSMLELGDVNQTGLVVLVTDLLLKKVGVVMLAVIVTFACLTTAIGLVSSGADYFGSLTGGRLPYAAWVAILCVSGMIISNAGITAIINVATPILNIIYPILIGQIVLSFFDNKIKNDHIFIGTAIGTLLVCLLGVAADFRMIPKVTGLLPLASVGLYWILPALLGGVIGACIPMRRGN